MTLRPCLLYSGRCSRPPDRWLSWEQRAGVPVGKENDFPSVGKTPGLWSQLAWWTPCHLLFLDAALSGVDVDAEGRHSPGLGGRRGGDCYECFDCMALSGSCLLCLYVSMSIICNHLPTYLLIFTTHTFLSISSSATCNQLHF